MEMSVPEPAIIPFNTEDDPTPIDAPIYDDESSDDDSFIESPHTESEGGFFKDVAKAELPTPFPPEAPNIDP